MTHGIPSDGDSRLEGSLHSTVKSEGEGSEGSTRPATPSSDAEQVLNVLPLMGHRRPKVRVAALDRQGDEGWYNWRDVRYGIGAVADAEDNYDADPMESFAVSVDLRDRLRNRSLPAIDYRPEQPVVAFLSNNTRVRLESWETDFN
nr:uncharacterized protein I203_02470 [Kwoniella mangroviensis CBS 8507]OCF69074.1 hypothetical protein I203_02470 [Kwoniella mangroviensis CBS 8507]